MRQFELVYNDELSILDGALFTYIYHEVDEELIKLARATKVKIRQEIELRKTLVTSGIVGVKHE